MKKIFTLLATIMSITASAQQHGEILSCPEPGNEKNMLDMHGNKKTKHHQLYWSDVSVHISKGLSPEKSWEIKAWALHHSTKRVTFDIHTGFHLKNTLDVGIGYDLTTKKGTWLVPKGSILIGEHIGVAPGFLTRIERDRFYVLNQLQYLITVHKNRNAQMLFTFLEVGIITHPAIEIGFITELKYIPQQIEIEHTIGPVVRCAVKTVYFEAWWSVNTIEIAEHHREKLRDMSALTFAVGWRFNKCGN